MAPNYLGRRKRKRGQMEDPVCFSTDDHRGRVPRQVNAIRIVRASRSISRVASSVASCPRSLGPGSEISSLLVSCSPPPSPLKWSPGSLVRWLSGPLVPGSPGPRSSVLWFPVSWSSVPLVPGTLVPIALVPGPLNQVFPVGTPHCISRIARVRRGPHHSASRDSDSCAVPAGGKRRIHLRCHCAQLRAPCPRACNEWLCGCLGNSARWERRKTCFFSG